MNRLLHIVFAILGIALFAALSLIFFPYLIVGGLCRATPWISRRRWLVNTIAMTLPLLMRYGLGSWSFRLLGESASDIFWFEIVRAVVNIAFSHIFVWAGFLSLNAFLGEIRKDTPQRAKPAAQA